MSFLSAFPSQRRVLIETYWNVNLAHLLWHRQQSRVLIETYWNVNYELGKFKLESQPGLNRNILECK